ncbi:MAG: hypothetical protein GX902_11720 [Lentisphaerae bacterium]|nr:hypothetical protein [Lentisphaerota bacterium]
MAALRFAWMREWCWRRNQTLIIQELDFFGFCWTTVIFCAGLAVLAGEFPSFVRVTASGISTKAEPK